MTVRRAIALALAVAPLLACGGSPAPQLAVQTAVPEPGRHVYQSSFCADCHGLSRQGSALAPPLRGLASHWDEGGLAAFLRDPAVHRAENERLRRLASRYTAQMPAQPALPDEELEQLVLYLLSE